MADSLLSTQKNVTLRDYKHVTIVGLQRTGTTILTRSIANHPSIFGLYQECHIVPNLQDVWENHKWAAENITEVEDLFGEKTVAVLKMKIQYRLMQAHFDCLDHLYFAQPKHLRKPIACKGIYLYQRFKDAIMFDGGRIIMTLRHPLVMMGSIIHNFEVQFPQRKWTWENTFWTARRWVEVAQVIVKGLPDIAHVVRYEDVCSHPEEVMRDISSWLGIEFDFCLSENYKAAEDHSLSEEHRKVMFEVPDFLEVSKLIGYRI